MENDHIAKLDALKEKFCVDPTEFQVLLEGLMHLAGVLGGRERQSAMIKAMLELSKG